MSVDWLSLLTAEAARTNITQAAKRCGLGRQAASMALSGKYGARTDNMAAKVIAALGRVSCPHLGRDLLPAACEDLRSRPIPTGDHRAFRQWRACQACDHGNGGGHDDGDR